MAGGKEGCWGGAKVSFRKRGAAVLHPNLHKSGFPFQFLTAAMLPVRLSPESLAEQG